MTPPLDETKIKSMLAGLEGWLYDGSRSIYKEFQLNSFSASLRFLNKIGELPESKGQHTYIRLSSNIVRVEIGNREIEGLTEAEFKLAAEVEKTFRSLL
jgi:4a-hydroxytetrahydrobiopterin dehydratase